MSEGKKKNIEGKNVVSKYLAKTSQPFIKKMSCTIFRPKLQWTAHTKSFTKKGTCSKVDFKNRKN